MTVSLGSPCEKMTVFARYSTTRLAIPADSRNAWASKAAGALARFPGSFVESIYSSPCVLYHAATARPRLLPEAQGGPTGTGQEEAERAGTVRT